ncbi:MAG: hypothetical protein U9Q95_04510, partial [Candidatus Eisenbacteria bacterium]|nr:hypothetical protein [Candidatus Eisenbacteria bacterium]
WTGASLSGRRLRPASSERHGTHVLMMDVLHRMTGSDEFAEAARRWGGYARNSGNRARARLERARASLAGAGVSEAPE